MAGAANRDTRMFEYPNKFDIRCANAARHFSSQGPHICIGQHLARVEITHVVNTLLDELPNLRSERERSE